MLGKDVEIVRPGRHQVRIAGGHRWKRSLVRVDGDGGHEVADIGPSDSP